MADATALAAHLPPDIDAVVAIPRSGMPVGALLAEHLGLPLYSCSRQRGVEPMGHGYRLEAVAGSSPAHVLLVDDTVGSGREMRLNLPLVVAAFPGEKVTRAVVYALDQGAAEVDLCWARVHNDVYLEWHWPNSFHLESAALDFDGILCRDFTTAEWSDPARYRAVMARIEPRFLPRRYPVPLVVTARPEDTRGITEDWLDRHGVQVDRLVMRAWDSDPTDPDWTLRVAAWKARHFRESDLRLFVESDAAQATAINQLSGKPVLCPDAGKAFAVPALTCFKEARTCPHREPESCSRAICKVGRGGVMGRVSQQDCLGCPSRLGAPVDMEVP